MEQFYTPLNRPPEIVSISVLAAGTRLESKTDSFDDSKGFTLPDIKLDDFVTDPQGMDHRLLGGEAEFVGKEAIEE